MSWINNCRVAILLSLLVAIMGPWTFDLIHVPSEYPCSAPFIRLEGDFCGTPMSGGWILVCGLCGVIDRGVGLVTGATGTMSLPEWVRAFFLSLCPFLLVLPFFSTLLLILRRDRRRRQVFNIVVCGLAAGAGLLLGVPGFSRPGWWMLWGIWLYIGLTVSALVLEVLTLVAETRPRQE